MTEDTKILEAVSRFSTGYIGESGITAEAVPRELLLQGGKEALKRVRLETVNRSNRCAVIESPKSKRRFALKTAAACAAVCIIILALIIFLPGRIIATLDDGRITVREYSGIRAFSAQAAYRLLTGDEVFLSNTSVIRGTITDIQYIEVILNGVAPDGRDVTFTNFYGIVSLQVKDCLRGDERPGDTLKILVHNLVNSSLDVWIEDTEIISQVRKGMDVIFMPKRLTDDEDNFSAYGVTLRYKDLAPYVLPDVVHNVILDTPGGLAYAKWAYEGMDSSSLDSAEEYVRRKLSETAPIMERLGTDLAEIFIKQECGQLREYRGGTEEMTGILRKLGWESDYIEALLGHTVWYEDDMYYYLFDSSDDKYGALITKVEKRG